MNVVPARLGCLSALQRLQRRGLLSRQEYLCMAAARSGQLEECMLRANGCPWDEEELVGGEGRPPRGAALGAHERLPGGRGDVRGSSGGRAPRGAAVGARERLPVEQVDVLGGGKGWAPRGASVGVRERLST